MPVRGGPVGRVTDWLAQLGGLERDFVQKTLRQWKRAHPRHRSFTVVRHPLARAHAVFCDHVLGSAQTDFRAMLTRQHGVMLPDAGENFPDLRSHRDAFLAFLRFVKKNLGGQTATKVDALWATQSAVLQGFSQFQPPDAVLREERLAEGLDWLCAEAGVTPPAPPPAAPVGQVPLSAVSDDEVQGAARDAYLRDYIAFGYRDLKP
jgi:hypothetical protein